MCPDIGSPDIRDLIVFTFLYYVQMARLYHDSTLRYQIELTLTRLILEDVDVRTHVHSTLAL